MYAVIFRAQIKHLDDEYTATAVRMRELAINKYNCLDFTSCTQADQEIAISYWSSEDDIISWRQDPEHLAAQEKGRSRWYTNYSVEVTSIKRSYTGPVNG